jgi:hypothetical protein
MFSVWMLFIPGHNCASRQCLVLGDVCHPNCILLMIVEPVRLVIVILVCCVLWASLFTVCVVGAGNTVEHQLT